MFARSRVDLASGAALHQATCRCRGRRSAFKAPGADFVTGAGSIFRKVRCRQAQHFRKVKCRLRGRRSAFARLRADFEAGIVAKSIVDR